MNVLIADKLPAQTLKALDALGLNIRVQPTLTAETLTTSVADIHVLVVRSTKVSEEVFKNGEQLQLVIRAGAGTNTIDCESAARHAVQVCNCPGKNAIAVAELTLGLVLSLDRFIPDNVISLRAGRWEKSKFGKGRGLAGRTFGVIGFGRIGSEVAHRAQSFGMNVVAWSRSLTKKQAKRHGVLRAKTIHELATRSDVLSVHLPYSAGTHHLVGADVFDALPEGALFVNASRGGVVDDAALLSAVRSGRLRAASDVFEEEPKGGHSTYDGPFRDLDGFYGTHHIGASTAQAQQATGDEVVRVLRRWLQTGEVLNCVNRGPRSPAKGQLIVRHLDRVGVLASVLRVLSKADINVKEMQNTIFGTTGSAVANITLDAAPTEAVLEDVRSTCGDLLGLQWILSHDEPQ